jgi:hypothetical protein
MAQKPKTSDKKSAPKAATTTPKFPYTTKPASLRRLLKEIPKKPKPPKFDKDLLKSWGFGDTNDLTMLRVLKAINLLNDKNEPTDLYSQFMRLDTGARAIAPEIRRVYAPMFQASHTPFNESNEFLQNLFNIHSGGGDRALDQQIQTFKALCENAVFDGTADPIAVNASQGGQSSNAGASVTAPQGGAEGPIVNINLHIHLPENKSRRDYEDIIEDIGRYIFGRQPNDRRDR